MRKLLTTHTEERSVHANSESLNIRLIQLLQPIIIDNLSTHSYIVS